MSERPQIPSRPAAGQEGPVTQLRGHLAEVSTAADQLRTILAGVHGTWRFGEQR